MLVTVTHSPVTLGTHSLQGPVPHPLPLEGLMASGAGEGLPVCRPRLSHTDLTAEQQVQLSPWHGSQVSVMASGSWSHSLSSVPQPQTLRAPRSLDHANNSYSCEI